MQGKRSIQVPNKSMDFNIIVYKKFIDIVSNSILKSTLKKPHLSSSGFESKNNTDNHMKGY